ncbi:MAG TPA: sulfite exporter TauE/SafE family protein [Bryobacteraceae bacterium]|nr:sulfite exporter TauE/SafE family protein [Bryobacteraceae bacterium]
MTTLAGLLIALAIGLTGIGGGVLTAPVLLLFLGMPAPQAVGTALVFVAIVKLFAAPVYIVRKQVNYRILALLLAGGIPGALLGSIVLDRLNTKGMNGPLLLLLGITIVLSASLNFVRKQAGAVTGVDKSQRLPFACFPIGLEVGFSSAGAGALGSLALMHWTTLTPSAIVGTDILFGFGLSVAAGSIHMSNGGVDSHVLRLLLLGGVPGAILGAWLGTRFPSRGFRKALALWLIYLGANLCWRGIGALTV